MPVDAMQISQQFMNETTNSMVTADTTLEHGEPLPEELLVALCADNDDYLSFLFNGSD